MCVSIWPPFAQEAEAQGLRHYGVNLDPACLEVPFPVRVDIRDTVSAKSLQRKMGLGPNGAIVTALNLFATRVSQVGVRQQGAGAACALARDVRLFFSSLSALRGV